MDELSKWFAAHPDLIIALVLAALGLTLAVWIKPKIETLDRFSEKSAGFETKEGTKKLEDQLKEYIKRVDDRVLILEQKPDYAALIASATGSLDARANTFATRFNSVEARLVSIESSSRSWDTVERAHDSIRTMESRLSVAETDLKHVLAATEARQVTFDRAIAETLERFTNLLERSQREIGRKLEAKEGHITSAILAMMLEQAEQDVQLAKAAEFLARMPAGETHEAAKQQLARANARLEELKAKRRDGQLHLPGAGDA